VSQMQRVVVVDDEQRLADLVCLSLTDQGYAASAHARAADALAVFENEHIDVVISDLRMPDMDGRQLMHAVKQRSPDTAVIIMTAYASVRDAVDLVKQGAYDFVPKPFDMDELLAAVERALQLTRTVRDNKRLREELEGRYRFDQMIGTSARFRAVIGAVTEVCESRATVLLTGESGTGKELVARAIHFNSPRRSSPFIAVNCAAIPEGLLESELFGHVKGAFTGAVQAREGRFRAADGGTLFLDEIGDMPLAIQAKILRVLQERAFEPLGSTRSQQVDVRIVVATHRDLPAMVADGSFREDLYYRLNVFPITLPSLRERLEDLEMLALHFLKHFAEEMGKRVLIFSADALAAMRHYQWPGNIRELQNCVERAVLVCRSQVIDVGDLPPYLFDQEKRNTGLADLPHDLDGALEQIERDWITEALRRADGVQVRAAHMLGIAERSLWHRIKKYNLGKRSGPSDKWE
jgi:two-component system response regulator AtoC